MRPVPDAIQPGSGEALETVQEPRRRLHPLSPLLHGLRTIIVVIGAVSLSNVAELGWRRFALSVVVVAFGAVILSLINWLNTGYHIVGRELRIYDGLLWRRTRAIPLERLQSVEVVRPLLARLTGLAELRLEVVGGGKTEAPLAYLTIGDATRLRERLLALSSQAGAGPLISGGRHQAVEAGTPGEAAVPASLDGGSQQPVLDGLVPSPRTDLAVSRPVHTVRNHDLVISQVLTPQTFFLPLGVAFVLIQFFSAANFNLIAIASAVAAMGGVLLQPVRRVVQDWNFRASAQAGGLRLAYGLLETRNQTVPLTRLQGVTLTWPLLWRMKGWLRMRFAVAGYAGPEQGSSQHSDRLLPVGDLETGRLLLAEALPGLDLVTIVVSRPPERARWLHPFAWRTIGVGFTEEVFAAANGVITRELVAVPYARIQSVRVVQGPLQRRLRLATVHADTAAGAGAAAADRDVTEAWALAAELTARAHAAQTTPD